MRFTKSLQFALVVALTPLALAQILDAHDQNSALETRSIQRSGNQVHGTPHGKESSDDDGTPLLPPDHIPSDWVQFENERHHHKARSVQTSGHRGHGTPHGKESSDDDGTPLLPPDHIPSDWVQFENDKHHQGRPRIFHA
ncbi:hypothetical protein MCOR27_011394 [Pyricularia oryzae]|uniref:Uncharacterized protein n=2 Tax=Pyricularia TaxID=48558 RepID=A0ABQ8NJ17_PYRGI|nr:hypothetical protein MCOR01_006667 [Pyricularia oryzae]KAI6296921.1 hypothetical protein MCOR33_006633 [Pyricularia grisea]KAH9435973.1 hypothetical protein MCOR02_004883 [Pyricularia oryzae]KAI6252251.1 hypothetical protein MCOR19_011136 [Pyricularia oryzae]KAI6263918.1 hypothetical protein MCOR26_011736 [Pyricularia oryzae]